MGYRLKTFSVSFVSEPGQTPKGHPIRCAEDLEKVARVIFGELDADKEHFVVLVCNNKNRINGFKVIATGSLTSTIVHPREVYTAALNLTAAAIAFVHNHPSGDPAPSQEDIEITRRLKQVGDIMGIRVLDHLVLGHEGQFFSFSDRGML